MTAFARSDVMGVTHPVTGNIYERKIVKKATKNEEAVYAETFSIDGDPDFESWLLTTFPDQWARRADKVPLTPDEQIEKEQAEKEGTILTGQMARAMAEAAAQAVVGARAA